MRVVGLTTLVVVASWCVAISAPALHEVRKPVDPPAGEWWLVTWTVDGEAQDMGRDRPAELKWTVTLTKNKMIVAPSGRPLSSGRRVEYYQTGAVLEFDLSPDLRAADPTALKKGIWEVDGDILKLCYGEPGGDRPTDFTARKDSGRTLWILKRKPQR